MSTAIHRCWRLCGRLALLGFALFAFAPSPAHAAKLFTGSRVLVAETDTLHDDVYVTGGNVTVRGTIDGDVVACGGQVGVNGNVLGSVIAAGGQVEVYGDVAGSVRAAGGKVTVGARVTRDLVAGGGSLEVLRDTHVGRDAMLGGGRIDMDGQVDRNVRAGTDQLILGSESVVGGDLDYASSNDARRDAGAVVKGKTTWYARDWSHDHETTAQRWLKRIWKNARYVMGVILLGLLFVMLFPAFGQRALEKLATQPFPSLGIGLLTCIGIPVVAAAFFGVGLLIGGWWIGAEMFVLWFVAMALGVVVATMTIGRWLGARMGMRGVALGWALLIGSVLVGAVRLIPFAGPLLVGLAMLGGLGALAICVGAAISAGRTRPAA